MTGNVLFSLEEIQKLDQSSFEERLKIFYQAFFEKLNDSLNKEREKNKVQEQKITQLEKEIEGLKTNSQVNQVSAAVGEPFSAPTNIPTVNSNEFNALKEKIEALEFLIQARQGTINVKEKKYDLKLQFKTFQGTNFFVDEIQPTPTKAYDLKKAL